MWGDLWEGFTLIPRTMGLGWSEAAYLTGVIISVAAVVIPVYFLIRKRGDDE